MERGLTTLKFNEDDRITCKEDEKSINMQGKKERGKSLRALKTEGKEESTEQTSTANEKNASGDRKKIHINAVTKS